MMNKQEYKVEMFRKLRDYSKVIKGSYLKMDSSKSEYMPNWFLYDKKDNVIASLTCSHVSGLAFYNVFTEGFE